MSTSTNVTSACDSADRLCYILVYQLEIIVIPVLFLVAFLFVMIILCCLRLFHDKKVPSHRQHHNNRKQHLQGIDAPPELNPLEYEAVPMTVQAQEHMTSKQPAEPQMATEGQQRAFEQITPLRPSFTIQPDKTFTLYQATLDQKPVVLRVLNESADSRDRQVFLSFAYFLSELGPHPFLPRFVEVIKDKTPLTMILEGLENRDLLGFLWRCRKDPSGLAAPCAITEKLICSMARQIASALEHLHSKECTHGNIGARSVLVDRDLSVKLWGFGPAFHRRMNMGSTGDVTGIEMRKWQAPEVLAHRTFSQHSDIWSFGVLLYEMVTLGEPPFPKVMANELLQYLQRGNTLKRPKNCSNSLYFIIKSCCQWRPRDRASLKDIISMLQVAENHANDTVVLQATEPLDIAKYMQEAGYGEAYNFAAL